MNSQAARSCLADLGSLLPMPMVLMPWTERAVQWLRPYVERRWFDAVEVFYLTGPKGTEHEPGADMLTQFIVPGCNDRE